MTLAIRAGDPLSKSSCCPKPPYFPLPLSQIQCQVNLPLYKAVEVGSSFCIILRPYLCQNSKKEENATFPISY